MSRFVTNFEVGAETCLVRDPQIMHYEGLVNAKFPPDGMTAAVGDGTQNDTNAIKELIAYCINNNFPLYFPAGVYLTSPITVSGNLSIVGSGAIIRLRPVMSGPLITLEGGLIAQGVTFDANLSGQTTIQNVIQCNNGEFRFSECTVTGGKSCIIGTIKNDCTLYNCVLSNFTECGINVEGTGRIISTSVVIPNIASGGALGFIKLDVSNSYVVAWESLAEVPVGVEITGNDNYVNVNFPNAETSVNDEGQNNNWVVTGKSEKKYLNGTAYHNYQNLQETVEGDYNQTVDNFEGSASNGYTFNAQDIVLNPANPLTYKTPSEINNYFRYVPFKDSEGTDYDVLVRGTSDIDPDNIGNKLDWIFLSDYLEQYENDFDTAIKAALANVPAHGTLYIPLGQFTATQPIVVSKPMHIIGGYTYYDNQEVTTDCTLAEYSQSYISTSASTGLLIQSIDVIIEKLYIRSSNSNQEAAVCRIDLSDVDSNTNVIRHMKIKDCSFHGFIPSGEQSGTGSGIRCNGSNIVSTFENVWCYQCNYGFNIGTVGNQSTSLMLLNCWAINCTMAGYQLNGVVYSTFISCAADSQSGAEYGYVLDSCHNVSLIGCGCEVTQYAGIVIQNSSEIFLNASLMSYNQGEFAAAGGVRIVNSQNVTLLGCRWYDDQTKDSKSAVFCNNSNYIILASNATRVKNDNETTRTTISVPYAYSSTAVTNTPTNCSVERFNTYRTVAGTVVSGTITPSATTCSIAVNLTGIDNYTIDGMATEGRCYYTGTNIRFSDVTSGTPVSFFILI